MSRKLSVREITLLGLFTALILIQTYTPLGYIRLGLVEFTTIHLTVIVAACLLGPRLGALIGTIWGVTSMIYAYQSAGVLNPLFYNPLISVLPRLLVGLIAGLLFGLLKKRFGMTVATMTAAIVGSITNTILVLSGFYLFGYQLIFTALGSPSPNGGMDPVLTFVFSLVTTNTLLEILAAALIVPLLVLPLEKQLKK